MNVKKISITAILLATICLFSCTKENTPVNTSGTAPAPGDCTKFPYRKGSSFTLSPTSTAGITTTYTRDTTIGNQYYVGSVGSANNITFVAYTGLTSANEVINYLPQIGDLPRNTMILYKLGSPVNTTWNYTFASVATPAFISYRYTYTILSNSETISFAGINYSGGQRTRVDLQILSGGVVINTVTSFGAYCCGIGSVRSDDGTTVRSLTAYTY